MKPLKKFVSITGPGLALVCLTAGCGSAPDAGRSTDVEGSERVVSSASAFPVESTADLVTWTDTMAVFTVVDERVIPGNAGPFEGGSILDGRRVTVRIDDVIWQRPGTKQPPQSFETLAPGWFRQEGGNADPIRDEHGIRVEVGGTYVGPVYFLFDEWGISDISSFVVDNGRVAAAPNQLESQAGGRLNGLSFEEVESVLNSQEPDGRAGSLAGTTDEQLADIGVNLDS